METLFESKYENPDQSLRKYEPIIRFDIDGKPQSRKPLKETPKHEEKQVVEHQAPPKPPQEDLKRKVSDIKPDTGIEPKRKQQKQQSIMSFFNKKTK